MFRKTLALGVTLLFLGTIFVSAVNGDTGSSEPSLGNNASSNTAGESSSTASKASRTSSTSFNYGPLGNRVSSTDSNGDTTYYLYEGMNVIQDRQQDGILAREYVSGVGGKLAMIDHTDDGNKPAGEDEVLYYLQDILGSVVALINAGGAVVERYYYNPYGETNITDRLGTTERSDSAFGNTFMWTGKQYDPENELYHFPARSYSPTLGRWLQRDPLGYVDGLNLYEYVRSNPLRYVDPLGLIGGPGDTSDFWSLHNQAHEISPEAGDVFDEASTKFSMGVTLAVGGGAICARLGLITTSLFVGECAVDETISYYHGPDAAIFADTMMGGPGLYSAKEMAEQGIRGQLQSIRRQLGRLLDEVDSLLSPGLSFAQIRSRVGNFPKIAFPSRNRGPFILDNSFLIDLELARGPARYLEAPRPFVMENSGNLHTIESILGEFGNSQRRSTETINKFLELHDIRILRDPDPVQVDALIKRLGGAISDQNDFSLLMKAIDKDMFLITGDLGLFKNALKINHYDLFYYISPLRPGRDIVTIQRSYYHAADIVKANAPGFKPSMFLGGYPG